MWGRGTCETRKASFNSTLDTVAVALTGMTALQGNVAQNASTGAPSEPFLPQTPRQSLSFAFPSCGGFTLLEILLVLVVIAIASALAVPNLFQGPRETIQAETRRVMATLNTARDEAALSARVIGVAIGVDQLAFFERDPTDPNRWQRIEREPLKPHRVAGGVVLRAEGSAGQRLVFAPAGVAAPFSLWVEAGEHRRHLRVDALGNVREAAAP
jgi:type II secretion system protein H